MIKFGKQTYVVNNVFVGYSACVVGPKEHSGPLGEYFDKHYDDLYCNQKTWEKAEMKLLNDALQICLGKNYLTEEDVDGYIGGDLNNQIIIGNYVLRDYAIPYLGIFGACSTLIEGMIIGSNFIENNGCKNILFGSSSHNATSERQFRYPTEYGGQKPSSTTTTATASGVGLLTNKKTNIKVASYTIGKVVDPKISDSQDMGRIMAPAAFSTIHQHFLDMNTSPKDYDLIVTGDLSFYGREVVQKIFEKYDIDMYKNYNDGGLMLYDREKQNVFAGGSGCGCISAVTCGYLLSKLRDRTYKRIMIVGTGALLNPVIVAQNETIPAIAHLIVLEGCD